MTLIYDSKTMEWIEDSVKDAETVIKADRERVESVHTRNARRERTPFSRRYVSRDQYDLFTLTSLSRKVNYKEYCEDVEIELERADYEPSKLVWGAWQFVIVKTSDKLLIPQALVTRFLQLSQLSRDFVTHKFGRYNYCEFTSDLLDAMMDQVEFPSRNKRERSIERRDSVTLAKLVEIA